MLSLRLFYLVNIFYQMLILKFYNISVRFSWASFDLMFPYYLGVLLHRYFSPKHSFYLNKNEETLFLSIFENNYIGLAIFTGIFFGI